MLPTPLRKLLSKITFHSPGNFSLSFTRSAVAKNRQSNSAGQTRHGDQLIQLLYFSKEDVMWRKHQQLPGLGLYCDGKCQFTRSKYAFSLHQSSSVCPNYILLMLTNKQFIGFILSHSIALIIIFCSCRLRLMVTFLFFIDDNTQTYGEGTQNYCEGTQTYCEGTQNYCEGTQKQLRKTPWPLGTP